MAISTDARLSRWLTAGWLAFLLVLSFLPAQWKNLLHTKGQMHDTGHLIAFGVLAWLLARGARSRDQALLFLFLTAGLGMTIEFAQDLRVLLPKGSWAPVEWHDILLDTIAVVIAGVIYFAAEPFRRPAMRAGRSRGRSIG